MNGLKFCKAHNISHNDLKPENFLFEIEENDEFKIVLTDFGQVNSFGGTPGYASPENFGVPIVSKSDSWSLGKCLLFLYTTDEVFKCLTQIPIIQDARAFATRDEKNQMLKSLDEFERNNSIIEMIKTSLLVIGNVSI